MAAITGQPAPKPGQTANPVPGKDEALTAEAFLASFDAPETPANAESFVAQVAGNEPVPVEGSTPTISPEQFSPEPSFAQAQIDQFSNLGDRLRAGLAANDTEKLNFLKQKYGPDNAVIKDGELYFRKSSDQKLKRFDPDSFELAADVLDFSREALTETAMLPGEAVGGLVGFLSPVPGGAAAGGIAGRVASVPLANAAADKVAELAGVPRDETRSRFVENAIGMGAEALLPYAGGKIAKRLPGTLAYKEAKDAGKREIVALSAQSKEVAQAVQNLAEQGRAAKIKGELIGVPGAEVSLMGHQLNPDNPILKDFANQAASDPRFINAQTQLAEDWGNSLENTLKEIGRRGNPGPYKPEILAQTVTNAVADLEKAEGQAIGRYKAKAMANLKNQKLPLGPEARNQVQGLMNELGFNIRTQGDVVSIIPPKDLRPLVGKLGLTSIGEVRSVVNNVNEVAQGLKKGLTISDLDRLRNSVGSASHSLSRIQAGARLGALSGELRKAYRQGIESGLPEDFDRAAFNSAMDEFGALKENIGTLKGALNEDSSAKAIVKSVFTGKENLAKIEAIKKISPESMAGLKEEWLNQMMVEFGSRENKTGFKSSQFLDAIDKKYGRQFVEKVLNDGPGPNLSTVRDLLLVNERIEKQFKNVAIDNATEAQKKGAMQAFIGYVSKSPDRMMSGVASILGRDPGKKPLLEIMTRDGIDKYVAEYPGKIDKLGTLKKLNNILAESRFYSEANKLKRPSRAVLKSEAQGEVAE